MIVKFHVEKSHYQLATHVPPIHLLEWLQAHLCLSLNPININTNSTTECHQAVCMYRAGQQKELLAGQSTLLCLLVRWTRTWKTGGCPVGQWQNVGSRLMPLYRHSRWLHSYEVHTDKSTHWLPLQTLVCISDFLRCSSVFLFLVISLLIFLVLGLMW